MSRKGSNPLPSLKNWKELETMKKIILDESILDIDKWLPQDAIDQMVEIILQIENNRELRNEYDTSTMYGRTDSKTRIKRWNIHQKPERRLWKIL